MPSPRPGLFGLLFFFGGGFVFLRGVLGRMLHIFCVFFLFGLPKIGNFRDGVLIFS